MPKLEYGEFKGEYKGDSDSSRDRRADDAKGTDDGNVKVNATLERGELLMYVADEANSKLLGPNARLSKFVGKYTPEWEVAVEGERDGSGSPMKMMSRWKGIHGDYMDLMEEELGGLVRKNGGTMERFLVDAKHALDGGEGFLFDDENYSEFIDFVNAIADFEAFHELMMKECRKGMGGHAVMYTGDRK